MCFVTVWVRSSLHVSSSFRLSRFFPVGRNASLGRRATGQQGLTFWWLSEPALFSHSNYWECTDKLETTICRNQWCLSDFSYFPTLQYKSLCKLLWETNVESDRCKKHSARNGLWEITRVPCLSSKLTAWSEFPDKVGRLVTCRGDCKWLSNCTNAWVSSDNTRWRLTIYPKCGMPRKSHPPPCSPQRARLFLKIDDWWYGWTFSRKWIFDFSWKAL
jgi:hypothetical protein